MTEMKYAYILKSKRPARICFWMLPKNDIFEPDSKCEVFKERFFLRMGVLTSLGKYLVNLSTAKFVG